MELSDIVALAALAGFGLVVYLGFAVLLLKKPNPSLKMIRLMLLLSIGMAMAGIGIRAWVKMKGPPDFATMTPGPAQGVESITQVVEFPVNDTSSTHVVELTPMALQIAIGTARIVDRVYDPEGKVLSEGTQIATGGEGKEYQTLRFSLDAAMAGSHKLFVEIPKGVDQVRVVVKEVR
ncbi:MAG: hypothetical protein FJW36_09560 [Acidobacteria bacterium]|nr:hypothetical protein [Acidobacteriota bacterium]